MNTRQEALNILFKVFKNNEFSNKLLNKLIKNELISKKDIAFIFKLVYGTIQYKIYLEYVTNKLIDANKTDFKIQILLWMNLYQYKFLNAEMYYVVNEAVKIAKNINSNLVSLVNKVSKKLYEKNYWEVIIKNNQNKIPLEAGFPFWLFKKIEKDYSKEKALNFIRKSIQQSKITIRVNTLKISIESFEEKYLVDLNLEPSKLMSGFYLLDKNIIHHEIFEKGLVTIQDQASGLASVILDPQKNSSVLDMCSAPGGKLTHIGQLMQNTGKITAFEINSKKISLILSNINRLGLTNVELNCNDALNIDEKKYDYILLDAPCSGYGVIQHKPEIKLKKYSNEEVKTLLNTQSLLLEKAYKCMKKNSFLVYSTCTINKDENEYQISKFIKKHLDLVLEKEVILFGDEYNTDGFYICRLRKK
ncbi:16S rRNA (cytosine(967)-C(5))-methyltransferase RsmB [Spiroplasma taiwanense]|uniref:16S rRNA (cytosine(967)-C(5))-methyltransferase n=1 Tax=Spiroplasma taiwanense CT-1 TaxID=1276220 RepID=S5MI13_9MOLU|nr:16S rRNA (cytosine(967)-C(5))-methyltransferase RsmB [Spiroplasma taiwanense]AGR41530.1 RNA-binding Sun protein [Spiroplasma taiwanense CT-1]